MTRHSRAEWEAFVLRVRGARWAASYRGYVFLQDEDGHLAKLASWYESQVVLARESGLDVEAAAERMWSVMLQDEVRDPASPSSLALPSEPLPTIFDYGPRVADG